MRKRQCQECELPIVGRSDKKFCSDGCRNSYNNRVNASDSNFRRNVNNTLGRNRRILKELNPTGKTKIRKESLLKKGFDFDFYTNSQITKSGMTYHYCYEQGYVLLEEEMVLLIVKGLK